MIAAALLAWLAVRLQEPTGPQGLTLPVDRDAGLLAAEYGAAVAEGSHERAAALLQRLLDSDLSLLLPATDGALFAGAAATARALLAEAPPEVRATRRTLLAERAAAELAAGLAPPDAARLIAVARRYDGLAEAERARIALAELWRDRGQAALAAAWDPRGDAVPAAPAPPPDLPARLPAAAGGNDPRLPALDAASLEPAWSRDFRHVHPFGLLVRHRVAVGDGLVFASDGYELSAWEAGTGAERWRFGGDPAWESLGGDEVDLLEEAASEHFLSVPVLAEGVLLCVLQETVALGRADSFGRIRIRRPLPARRLHAFDPASGRLLWRAAAPWDGVEETEPRGIACGAPAVSGGRVYLPVYDAIGTIDFSLQCLDLRTGRPLWKRFLASGQLESNLFGNVLKELAVPPPLAGLDLVQVCSHLGTFHALDAADGALRWTRTYARMRVEPTESGRVARRPQILGSNLGGGDATRVAWAPADGTSITLLDAESGALLGEWPALDQEGRLLSQLLAFSDDVLWATGSELTALPATPFARYRSTEGALAAVRELPLGRSGALVRGEVLVPDGMRSVERFDAADLSHRGRALDFGGDPYASGALHAVSGLLLIATPRGVSAYTSLASLLAALRDEDLERAGLEAMLPVAASLVLDGEPQFARGFAETATALAGRPEFAASRPALLGLGARAWLAAGEPARAEPILEAWLGEHSTPAALEACGLLLDEPLVATARPELIRRARRIAKEAGVATLRLRARVAEPLSAVLARAAALRALADGDSAGARAALAEILLAEDVGSLEVHGIPVREWSDALLRIVLEQPEQARAFEEEARAALTGAPLTETLLRAYGRARAGQDRLLEQMARTDLERSERLRLARWRREWGDPARSWPDLDAWMPERAPLPALPRALVAAAEVDASGSVLVWQAAGHGLRLFLPVYQRRSVTSILLGDRLAKAEHEFALADLQNRVTTLSSGAFATPEGCGVLLSGALLHFGGDGSVLRHELDREFVEYHPLLPLGGGLVAGVFRARDGFLRVRVLDGITGGIYLEEEFAATPGRRIDLRRDGRWLLLLEQNSDRALRMDLLFRSAPEVFGLPIPMTSTDLRTAVAMDGGVAYLAHRPGAGAWAVRAAPGRAPWTQQFDGAELLPARFAGGLAWLALPLDPEIAAATPRALHAILPGKDGMWSRVIGGPEARIAELDYPHPFDRRGEEVIVLSGDPAGGIRLTAHRPGAPEPSWSLRLADIEADSLRPQLPMPRPAADGWVVCLLQGQAAGARAAVHVLTLDRDGGLIARRRFDSGRGAVNEFWAEPVAGGVLLRNGDEYLLLGDYAE